MCEVKILTAAPVDQPREFQLHKRVKLRLPCISVDAAQAHLALTHPTGMVVRIEHGPKGGWNNPRYYTSREGGARMRRRSSYSWYIVLEVLKLKPTTPGAPNLKESELPF